MQPGRSPVSGETTPMADANPHIKATPPKNVFTKPLKADLKELFKALSKGIAHASTGKWDELATDATDAMSAIGMTTDPGDLAFLFVRRASARAIFDLVGEGGLPELAGTLKDSGASADDLDLSIEATRFVFDQSFINHPGDAAIVGALQEVLAKWLSSVGISPSSADAMVARLPTYFVYELIREWRSNSKSYQPLLDSLDTPFAAAGDREWAWTAYAAYLQKRTQESVFDETFSLAQVYVPLNAFCVVDGGRDKPADDMKPLGKQRRRAVVSLQDELDRWLTSADPRDALRVVSGGPGSGKSSFARIFAARVAQSGRLRVLFVPLHLIDPAKDLVEEVGRFIKDEGVLSGNPLDPEAAENRLLIIFDGLDELASQGKAAAETARAFVREVERTVERRNQHSLRLRVLLSGRELVVQENEAEFRRPRQVLTLLPYFGSNARSEDAAAIGPDARGEVEDPDGLLRQDLRQKWWQNYGRLTGGLYPGLPAELSRPDLVEVTSQPLLNYLVALSFTRGALDFREDINLNRIYGDLVIAVHQRGYERHRAYGPIRHMKVEDFVRVLEEIGLAAWHGDGRTTTVREIEDHCRASGLGGLLDVFQEGARAGVTRLLAAFFFRRYGHRSSGDPTFVFTHKSFGEYLAARRIVRALERLVRELDSRERSPDGGWDELEALRHWARVCGPSNVSLYLRDFLFDEIRLRPIEDIAGWQGRLTPLLSHLLRHGMPMEQLQVENFKDAVFQARNAEEALLVALNACARCTGRISAIVHPDPTAFGAWFRRIQGQRSGPEPALAARCLSYLNLRGICLDIGDFYNADFTHSDLRDVSAHFACFGQANLDGADLSEGLFYGAWFDGATLRRAKLRKARLHGARLQAILEGADLTEADLRAAEMQGTGRIGVEIGMRRAGAVLTGATLRGADLRGARLAGANLTDADLREANLSGVSLRHVKRRNVTNAKRGRSVDGDD